ncbi:tetratricopeptide repeat protein [Chitinasiproducens palmae]|uniref:Flp pilus assembly protein TadD, contains TPR repeats n=1 Tax=Chitinasiproducens palmae TaxID=1770053 RepID=A0A1H2PPI2_9BURK|nr:tetratricopeptide repeat protein [Chitinasiproducens palmae]SDV48213.1 Flp pilus assembly protein TadD, contains TPR repeats [Chitinasiproducens palmae]
MNPVVAPHTAGSQPAPSRSEARAAPASLPFRLRASLRTLTLAGFVGALSYGTAYAQDADTPAAPPADAAVVKSNSAPPIRKADASLPNTRLTSQIVYQVLAAEIALQRGQVAPAYQTYMALARESRDPRMAQRAAEIALKAQSPGDALTAARLWRQYAPNSEQAVQLDTSLLVLAGKLDDARPVLVAELARVPQGERGAGIIALQSLLARAPDPVAALALLQDLLKNDLQRPEARFAIARQQIAANDIPGARASLEAALNLKPNFEPAALLLGQMGPAERREAIATLAGYVDRHPDARETRVALAQLYVSDNQPDAARAQFEAMRKQDPLDLTPLLALGMLDLQAKRYDAAEQSFRQYVAGAEKQAAAGTVVDPGQAYLFLAQISLERGDKDGARAWLGKVSPNSSRYVNAQIGRAQLLADAGQYDAARDTLASLQPRDPQEAVAVGRAEAGILFVAKRYPEAEKKLAALSQLVPDDPDVAYDHAMAAERTGHYEVMENELRRLIALDPTNPQAYNALGYSLADRNVRLDEAAKLVEKAVSLAPNDAYIQDSLGWVRYRQGDKTQALSLLQGAWDNKPNAEIGAHLGEVLWRVGRQDDARKTWQAAVALDADDPTLLATLRRFKIEPRAVPGPAAAPSRPGDGSGSVPAATANPS